MYAEYHSFFQFEAELLNCLQRAYGIDLSIGDMVSSWRRLIDPLLNMAKKMRILTTIEEGTGYDKLNETIILDWPNM